MRTRLVARTVELAGELAVEDLGHERALARPGHAGHGDEPTEREADVDVLEVVGTGAADGERLAVALPPLRRDRDDPLPPQEGAGDRAWLGEQDLERPVGDDLAAVLARAGPDVEDPVGRPDRLLVVLDDEDRVAEVAQPGQGRDELGVVLLVEPDRRLVEDVQDAHQAGPDLGRQPDPLGLAAGQRLARPVDRQVVEPDVDEEAEAGGDLLDDLPGDRALALGQPVRQALDPASASVIDIVETSQMLRPSMVTARTSGLSRLPPQVGQGRLTMNRSSSVLTYSESVSR